MENKTKAIGNNRRDAINRVSIFLDRFVASVFFREIIQLKIESVLRIMIQSKKKRI